MWAEFLCDKAGHGGRAAVFSSLIGCCGQNAFAYAERFAFQTRILALMAADTVSMMSVEHNPLILTMKRRKRLGLYNAESA